jgi:hypothetical protein
MNMRGLGRVAAACLAAQMMLSVSVSAELMSFSYSSYPHLLLVKDSKLAAVEWHKQEMLFKLVHSAAVRISARGVRFIPQTHSLILSGRGAHWISSSCKADTTCLCSTAHGSRVLGRFLPNYPLPVYMLPSPLFMSSGAFQQLMGPPCSEGITGRVLAVGMSSPPEDISLCNILSSGADYVFVPSKDMLYLRVDPISNVALFIMSILVVYLMVRLGQNLQIIMSISAGSFTEMRSTAWTVVCMLALAATCCFCTSSSDVLGGFVTLEDSALFVAMVVHVVYYVIRIEANVQFGDRKRANPINPMITSISAAVQRVYGTADNPYMLILFFIMLTWTFHKISMLGYSVEYRHGGDIFGRKWRLLDVIMDLAVLCLMVYAGVFVTVHEELFRGAFVLQGVLAALTLNKGILPLHILYLETTKTPKK